MSSSSLLQIKTRLVKFTYLALSPAVIIMPILACYPTYLLQISGKVDQSASMLNDDITEKGFALLCVAQPTTDCKIQTIPEVNQPHCSI